MQPLISSTRNPSFVPRDERERLLVVFVDLVADRGFSSLTLEQLADHAEVGLDTVTGYFASLEECALAAADAVMEQCFTATAQAFVSTPGDCPLAARAALDAMLRFFAGMPSFVHLAVVENPRLGGAARSRRARYLDLFAEFLGPGFAAAGADLPPQPEVISRLIGGGIYELLSNHYLEGRLDQLPEALPAATFFTVVPFFGIEEARRVASLPMPTRE